MIIRGAATFINSKGQELVDHGTLSFPLGCYEEEVSAAPVHWHWHEDWEIVLATRGAVRVRTATEDSLLHVGDGIILGAGCLHEITGEGEGCALRSAVFHPRFVGSMDSAIWQRYIRPLQNMGSVILTDRIPWQKDCILLFRSCWSAVENELPGYEIQAREALAKIVFLLYSQLDMRRQPSARELRDSQRIKTMLQFIQEHYGEEMSVARIASSAMLSESECLRCFHSTINTTPGRYLKDYRLQMAAGLLEATDERTGDIGAACGFFDAAYFTKLFRETMGCTPGDYRRTRRAEKGDHLP